MGSMGDAFRKAGLSPAPLEPPPEKACARCGKNFRPARPQHKLCDECIPAVRAERASEPGKKPDGDKAAGERPAGAAAPAAPRPERERPPRRERPPLHRTGEGAPGPAARRFAAASPRELPANYLAGGYFTGPDGALRREFLAGWAEQIAQGLANAPADPTVHQIRAFHNHVKRVVAAVKYGKHPVETAINEVQKMKALAAERVSRRKLPELFREFVDANVDRVTDRKTLMAFAEHFDAVAAFASGLLQTRKERR